MFSFNLTELTSIPEAALHSPSHCYYFPRGLCMRGSERWQQMKIKCTQIPQTHMTNLPRLRFSWLLPPNTLAKMMMSDRNFYIPSQLTSQPCPPPALSVEAELTHACQTATSPFTLFNSAHS
ncbi:hypothetical protein CHARACLAT_028566 [Characodon lateralis]|uniref:Uncharacterized protein n=1 Tax=Characodon lateralis TaxID=208331 RepID=A0ABU7DCQ5_9TELE|nr:hypothetical protein [Characodon lateralis]